MKINKIVLTMIMAMILVITCSSCLSYATGGGGNSGGGNTGGGNTERTEPTRTN